MKHDLFDINYSGSAWIQLRLWLRCNVCAAPTATSTRLRLRISGLKCLGMAQTYAVFWYDWHHQTRHSLVFLKSPPLYIYCVHSCRWRHFFADIPISPHLAMLIRVIGSDRAVNTIWHRMVRLKPVQSCNVTIVISFGCLLFSKLPQQSRCRQNGSRYRRLFAGMSPFRRTQPC